MGTSDEILDERSLGATDPGARASAATPPAPSPAPGQEMAEIELIITGGGHAGSYRAVTRDACTSDVVDNRFVVEYRNDGAVDVFVALELIVRDTTLANEDETDDFGLTLGLGGPAGGTTCTIDPRGGQGDGSVLVELMPNDATVELTADAANGSTVELSIICSAL